MKKRVHYLYNNTYNQGCCRVCRRVCKKKKCNIKLANSGFNQITFSFNGKKQSLSANDTRSSPQGYLSYGQFALLKTKVGNNTQLIILFDDENQNNEQLYSIPYESRYDCLGLTTQTGFPEGPANSKEAKGNVYVNNKLIKKNVIVAKLNIFRNNLRFFFPLPTTPPPSP